jgi:ABC-type multidrug transport system ATPase subunit
MGTHLETRQLTKDFGDFRAVDDVSFQVSSGEIFGLLGPNGAGKTTTLRMLSGLLRPTSGEAFIDGVSVQQEPHRALRQLGFLTGEMDLYRRLKPRELLTYFGELYEVPKRELADRVERLMDLFDIQDFADRFCEKLSTGQKQRVSIARTLVHDPKVVVLDEPTTGLDIMSAEFVLQFIDRIAKEEKKAVIFSTHNLTEVERLCDRIAIIDRGHLSYAGSPRGLMQQTNTESLAAGFFQLVTT